MKKKTFQIIITISLLITLIYSGTKTKVEDLFDGKYSKDIYAGYLETDVPGNELFYIFTPAQNDNISAPLVLWLNGGPGCSSLTGFFTEIGPVTSDLYSGNFTVNEYAWNKEVNIIYIENPAGVGFTKNVTSDWDEEKTRKGLLEALKKFFEMFPDYISNDFYIAGESYAGVYIPNLAMAIVLDGNINLKGIMPGNPLTSFETDFEKSLVEFDYWHGIISDETWNGFLNNCPHLPIENEKIINNNNYKDYPEENVTHLCNVYRQQIQNAFNGNDIYGIYRKCPVSNNNNKKHILTNQDVFIHGIKNHIKNQRKKYNSNKKNNIKFKNEYEPPISLWPSVSCSEDSTMRIFLNENSTQEKLGFTTYKEWNECTLINYPWNESIEFYNKFIVEHKDLNLKVWVYSGDQDAAIPTLGTIRWIHNLGYNIIEDWKKWIVDNQVAGMTILYDYGIRFISIKGAGHMVPQDKRKQAKVLFDAFIKGEF